MSENAPDEFYGWLGRTRFESDRATLRFYPFVFDPDAATGPVYEVAFDGPAFGLREIEHILGDEMEVSKSTNAVMLEPVFSGDKFELGALNVISTWQPYDIEDYISQVKQLNQINCELHNDLRDASNKIGRVHATTIELLRRAEIKASASPELQKTQAPALEVLKRIMFEIE